MVSTSVSGVDGVLSIFAMKGNGLMGWKGGMVGEGSTYRLACEGWAMVSKILNFLEYTPEYSGVYYLFQNNCVQ